MTPIHAELHRSTPCAHGQVRSTAVAAAVATALGVLLAPNAMAQAAGASDLQNLKQQVQKLQQEIDQLQTQQATQPVPQPAPDVSHNSSAAAASSPTFHAGPVTITLGGFVELMAIERNRNESEDFSSNYNGSIPYPNSHNYYLNEFHFSERQSRIGALVEGPG